MRYNILDILLERMLSLIPRKPDGKYVHGAKKEFCEKIGAPTNIISEWETGKTHSYRRYIHAVSQVYGVSLEWLRGESEQKEKPTPISGDGLTALDEEIIDRLLQLKPDEVAKVDAFVQGLLAAREA